jgi:hypothetical protein
VIGHFIACDSCGATGVELRVRNNDGWTADDLLCRECFDDQRGEGDESEFTDLMLRQMEAK